MAGRLAERHPLLFEVGDGRRGRLPLWPARPFRSEGRWSRMRPFPRLQLGDQIGRDPPSSIRQLAGQPIRREALEPTDISLYEVGRRRSVRVRSSRRQVFERPADAARGSYTPPFSLATRAMILSAGFSQVSVLNPTRILSPRLQGSPRPRVEAGCNSPGRRCPAPPRTSGRTARRAGPCRSRRPRKWTRGSFGSTN